MREDHSPPSAVVVGVDGSKAAIRAALWAVDEAASRDIPLRLVYAIEPGETSETDPEDAARKLATAEISVRYALTAVEAAGKPVKIEVEIVQASPTGALIHASRSAAMIVVGSVGLRHFADGRVGSTAASLAASAHCPVAIIRGRDDTGSSHAGWIVVEVDQSAENAAVMQRGVEEALLRHAPLRMLTAWQSKFTDIHDGHAVADGNRQARAQLNRRLARWTRQYPDLDIESVAVHGTVLNYLAGNVKSVQLVVVSARDTGDVGELVGPTGNAVLHDTDCSLLIVDRQSCL